VYSRHRAVKQARYGAISGSRMHADAHRRGSRGMEPGTRPVTLPGVFQNPDVPSSQPNMRMKKRPSSPARGMHDLPGPDSSRMLPPWGFRPGTFSASSERCESKEKTSLRTQSADLPCASLRAPVRSISQRTTPTSRQHTSNCSIRLKKHKNPSEQFPGCGQGVWCCSIVFLSGCVSDSPHSPVDDVGCRVDIGGRARPGRHDVWL
jgi:hypothetical protein